MGAIKKFITNKNTVTILGILLSIVIVVVCYVRRVNSAINPIAVPYAKKQIAAGTQITESMVGITNVPPSMLEGKVLMSANQVIDRYSNADTIIPEGSLFYERTVVDKEKLPANVILDYPSGYVLYNMSVNTESTYGNSVYPGNYIDIYLKVSATADSVDTEFQTTESSEVMLGKLLSNVKVIAVKDQNGQAVFENAEESKVPSMVIFALPEEYYILLKKSEFLRTYSSSLIPVPTNESLKENPNELEISSESLKEWINRVTIWTEN